MSEHIYQFRRYARKAGDPPVPFGHELVYISTPQARLLMSVWMDAQRYRPLNEMDVRYALPARIRKWGCLTSLTEKLFGQTSPHYMIETSPAVWDRLVSRVLKKVKDPEKKHTFEKQLRHYYILGRGQKIFDWEPLEQLAP